MGRVLRCVLAVCVLALTACAQDLGDIDRTQAGLLRKALFEGEWLMRRTVIDAPYDTGWTFIGEQDEAVRIRWDIQADKLVAWRVTPHVDGTEDAAPAGAWPIEAHVDVKRQYSEATGEQSNVIEENTSDRLWFEREYIRVDWSNNLVRSFAFVVDGLAQQPLSHALWDPADPDRFLVGVRTSEGWTDTQDDRAIRDLKEAHYIDYVTRVAVEPDTVAFDDGYGGVVEEPACWYYLTYDCAPGVVSVRSSFVRTDAVSTDYAPLPYPDNRVARDADGKPIRVRWNEDGDLERAAPAARGSGAGSATTPSNPYAETDTSVARIPYFDKFGYFRIERGGYDPLYGEVESSKTYLATLWNIWQRSRGDHGSALPYRERGYRPIIYYLSPGFPERLRDAAQRSVDQWNEALLATVKVLDPDGDPPRLFELRENTRTVDPDSGKVLTRGEVMGDLRYSHLWLVEQPTRVGLLGYGPSAIDPLTGEIVSADAFIYGAAGLELAARGRDMVELINGRLDPQELALGDAVAQAIATGATKVVPQSAAKVKEIARAHRGAAPAANASATKAKGPPKAKTAPKAAAKLARPAGWADARLGVAKGTSLEALLASDAQIVALKGGGTPNLARTSPLRWATPAHRRAVRERMRTLAKRTIMLAPLVDDAVAGLAIELKDEAPDKVVLRLEEAIMRSTMEHEIGHTLGLRHNFEGSTDALNYHDGYWDLRGENGEPLDEQTDAQVKGRMRELQYSSIMDYAGRFNMDTAGLGRYDRAAIAFGYGGLVEVFEQAPDDPLLELVAFDDDTYDRPFTLDGVLRDLRHYTRIPSLLGGKAGMRKRTLVPYTGEVAALMGRPATDAYAAQLTGDAPWTHWEVPYRFCSDEYEGATATCHVYDAGADAHEIVADAVERWRAWYWFYAFRRDRILFDEWDYMDVMWGRTYGLIQLVYQGWVFDQWFKADTWEWLRQDPDGFGIEDAPWEEAADAGLAGTAAAQQGLRFLFEVLATPEPGAYIWDPEDAYSWQFDTAPMDRCKGELAWESEDWCSDANVPLGTGRWFLSLYDVDSGYGFYDRLKWVGSFYDKLLALEALTSPDTYFLGIDTFQSADEWAISMNLSFGDEIRRLLTGIAADRFDLFAGTFDKQGNWVPPDPFGPPASTKGPTGGAVDPQTSFTVQLYALWYGMAWLNANFDNSFNDFAKIWLAGSGEAIDVDPAKIVAFTNPFNGRTYVTLRPDAGSPPGVGATMLDEAHRLLGLYDEAKADPDADASLLDYYAWRVQNLIENVEVVRGLHDLYGMLVF